MALAAPTVHLNGTSRQELLQQFLDARAVAFPSFQRSNHD